MVFSFSIGFRFVSMLAWIGLFGIIESGHFLKKVSTDVTTLREYIHEAFWPIGITETLSCYLQPMFKTPCHFCAARMTYIF